LDSGEPFSKVEWKAIAMITSQVGLNEQSLETLSEPEPRRKIGGQPGNKNAGKKYLETIENESETNQNESENESENESHDHSLHLHLHDHVMKMLEKIKIASEKLGISIENPHPIAEKFLASGIKADWLFSQNYDFLDFVVFWLKTHKKYSKKSSNEQRNLFISAVSWDELRQKYPEWREKQEKKQKNESLKAEKKAIRENYPTTCPHCAAAIENGKCWNCRGYFTYDEANQKFIFNNGLEFDAVTYQIAQFWEEKTNQKAATSGPSEKVASG
jgi:hypothetical protein